MKLTDFPVGIAHSIREDGLELVAFITPLVEQTAISVYNAPPNDHIMTWLDELPDIDPETGRIVPYNLYDLERRAAALGFTTWEKVS